MEQTLNNLKVLVRESIHAYTISKPAVLTTLVGLIGINMSSSNLQCVNIPLAAASALVGLSILKSREKDNDLTIDTENTEL